MVSFKIRILIRLPSCTIQFCFLKDSTREKLKKQKEYEPKNLLSTYSSHLMSVFLERGRFSHIFGNRVFCFLFLFS